MQTAATESVLAALNGDSMCSITGSADGTTNVPDESRAAGAAGTGGVAAAGVAPAAPDFPDAPDDDCERTPPEGEKRLIAITPNDDATMSMIPPAFADTFLLTLVHH